MGLVEALRKSEGGVDDVARYYRAARIYNSGSVDPSGDLGKGVATHCYASDVANRLRGWVMAEDTCDGPGVGNVVPVEPAAGTRKAAAAIVVGKTLWWYPSLFGLWAGVLVYCY